MNNLNISLDEFTGLFNKIIDNFHPKTINNLSQINIQNINEVRSFSTQLSQFHKMIGVLDPSEDILKKITIILKHKNFPQEVMINSGLINTVTVRALTGNKDQKAYYSFVVDMMTDTIRQYTKLGMRPVQIVKIVDDFEYTCSLNSASGLWFIIKPITNKP
ncbi:hypothetical protein [Neisseria sp. Ec49-e6-T10]|uniref:hypothetical protein n=1 Tax=Neisseria sp. Ec49-e6-T10 TaxID=3140744 RepID=UPI003EBF23C1